MTTSQKVNVNFSQTVSLPDGGSVEVTVGEVFVEAHQIIGTGLVIIEVWEKSPSSTSRPWAHSNIKFDEQQGCWLGRVVSRDLPASIDAIPFKTGNRVPTVRNFWEGLRLAAGLAIAEAVFPWHTEAIQLHEGEGQLVFSTPEKAAQWIKGIEFIAPGLQ